MKSILLVYFFAIATVAKAQLITGQLNGLSNKTIALYGFKGFDTYVIAHDTLDPVGNFKIQYASNDKGIGFLSADSKTFNLILSGESIKLIGNELSDPNSIEIQEGKENLLFERYVEALPRREQALSAWTYLERIYENDALFTQQVNTRKLIELEKKRILREDSLFLSDLPKDSYIGWYLPTRKLISAVPVVVQYRPEEIPSTINALRNLNYADDRLYKSGLLKDAIESQFWLLENSGLTQEAMYSEMRKSIDYMLIALFKDDIKLNLVTNHVFELLERRSHFNPSEYLALKVLNEVGCTLNSDLARQLESYRAMKKGNTAADISFTDLTLTPGHTQNVAPKKLSDLKSSYTVVVFGSSWCPQCAKEIPEMAKRYPKWKQKNIELVFVSLDTDKSSFHAFAKDFPFISTCDLKKWDGDAAQSYYIFATPTFFILDNARKIVARPNNLEQLEDWIRENG